MSSPRLLVNGTTVNRLLLETEQSYSQNNRFRIMQDCQEALRQCPSLVARVDTLTHNNGFVSRLICLGGTVAVRYRGNAYNIPVDIWIPEPYPTYPPLVYVTPTPNMYIPDDHPYVDKAGLVNLPYLTKWDPASYSIAGLVGVLVSVFSSKPPVFAKPPTRRSETVGVHKPLPVSPCRHTEKPTKSQTVSAEELHRRELVTLVEGKIRRQFEEIEKKGKTEITQLLESRQVLQKGSEAIQEGMDSISVARVEAEKETINTEKQLNQTRQWLEENQHLKGTLNIDDIIIFPDSVQRKIVQYRAKDAALQDALYLLDEALEMNLLDLAAFLKEVRRLAKEQYKCRGMIQYLSRNRKGLS